MGPPGDIFLNAGFRKEHTAVFLMLNIGDPAGFPFGIELGEPDAEDLRCFFSAQQSFHTRIPLLFFLPDTLTCQASLLVR